MKRNWKYSFDDRTEPNTLTTLPACFYSVTHKYIIYFRGCCHTRILRMDVKQDHIVLQCSSLFVNCLLHICANQSMEFLRCWPVSFFKREGTLSALTNVRWTRLSWRAERPSVWVILTCAAQQKQMCTMLQPVQLKCDAAVPPMGLGNP